MKDFFSIKSQFQDPEMLDKVLEMSYPYVAKHGLSAAVLIMLFEFLMMLRVFLLVWEVRNEIYSISDAI